MASEITVTVLRFAFLILLWLFVFMILAASRRDLGVGRNIRTARARVDSPVTAVPPTPAHPAPSAPPVRPSLLRIVDGAQAGATMRLGDSPVTIGRANNIEVSLQDDYASSRHARLFPQGSRWFLEDIGSTNGTFLGEQRLTRATPVQVGQSFRVGRTTMQLKD